MQIAEVFVAIRPQVDKAGFQREVEQSVGGAAASVGTSAGKTLSTNLTSEAGKGGTAAGEAAGKNLDTAVNNQATRTAKNLGSIFAAVGAGLFLKDAFTVEQSALDSQAKLELVLKANGEQSGVTAQGLDVLTKSIVANTAATDIQVKSGAAILLTFQDVRNEAGQGNDIFNRSLSLSTDLAAFWGRDLTSSATQLGRALENPTAGISALTRSGIAFSAQVRQQITDLAKQGDLVGAQALILNQVQDKVGGAAAAIAANDPFKKFGQSITQFKEQLGSDLLPGATAAINVARQLEAAFGALPEPVRATLEGLALFGTVAAGVVSVGARVVGALDGLKASIIGVTTAEEAGAAATVGFGAAFTGILAGIGIGVIAGNKLVDVLSGQKISTDVLSKSLKDLAATHTLTGAAADVLGQKYVGLADDLGRLFHTSNFGKISDIAGTLSAKKDVEELNASLNKLADNQGIKIAYTAFEQIRDGALASGQSIDDVNRALDPFLQHIAALGSETQTAATGVDDLQTSIKQLADSVFTPQKETLGIEDAIATAQTSLNDLNQARLDAIGQGPKSQAAADAEATALQGLAAAQDNVKTSLESVTAAQQSAADSSRSLGDAQRSLADAQAKLAEFDSPVSQTIRALQRENIVRRAVSTPEQVRQKEIDLLSFDQTKTDQRASLAQSVVAGQENVSKAVEAVGKAYDGVSKAEENVQKATAKVKDAQDKVADAATKRKQVQVDAAAAVQTAERKAESAVIAVGDALAGAKTVGDTAMTGFLKQLGLISTALDPSGILAQRINALILQQQALANGPTPTAGKIPFIGPYDSATYGRLNAEASKTFNGPVSAQDRLLLHQAGVPGFETGGLANWPLGEARLAVLHGQETVNRPGQQGPSKVIHLEPHYELHNSDTPTKADLEWANQHLGWLATRLGNEA